MSFKGQSSGAAAAPQTKFKRGDLFDLVQEVAAEGGPRWSELLADSNLVEDTRDIDGISRHGLYLAAPHKEDSGLRRAEYSALYRHYVLTPSGKPWTTCPLPLLEFPFTAAEFMRFNSLLVDDLRDLLTTIRTVEGEDGNRFLDEQINHELVADLPGGAGELARILLSGDTAPSASAPAVAIPEPVATPAETVPAKWWEVVLPYMVETLKAGQFRSAKEFHRALEDSSGSPGSPFEKVQGELRVREFGQTIALKTMQNRWKEVRTAAGLR